MGSERCTRFQVKLEERMWGADGGSLMRWQVLTSKQMMCAIYHNYVQTHQQITNNK